MTDMIVLYISCTDAEEAKKIGEHIMKKRLSPCYNIIPNMKSASFWPPKTGKIEKVNGAILLLKSVDRKYLKIETEVKKFHSDKNPCIFSIPVSHVSKEYFDWLIREII
jgi:periplasmic divalent cation tolerance protein